MYKCMYCTCSIWRNIWVRMETKNQWMRRFSIDQSCHRWYQSMALIDLGYRSYSVHQCQQPANWYPKSIDAIDDEYWSTPLMAKNWSNFWTNVINQSMLNLFIVWFLVFIFLPRYCTICTCTGYVCTCTCTHTCTVHVQVSNVHACTCTSINVHGYTCTCTCVHVCSTEYTCTCTCTCIWAYHFLCGETATSYSWHHCLSHSRASQPWLLRESRWGGVGRSKRGKDLLQWRTWQGQ